MQERLEETLDWLMTNEQLFRGRTRIPIAPSLRDAKKIIKAFEIIKKKNINVFRFKSEQIINSNFTYKYYVNNYGTYHNGMKIELLDEDEFNLLKDALKEDNSEKICDEQSQKYHTCYDCPLQIEGGNCFKHLDLDKEFEVDDND